MKCRITSTQIRTEARSITPIVLAANDTDDKSTNGVSILDEADLINRNATSEISNNNNKIKVNIFPNVTHLGTTKQYLRKREFKSDIDETILAI